MKKISFLLVAAVLTASVCVQNSYGQNILDDITFGVRAGANFTKFGGSDADVFSELIVESLGSYGLKIDMKKPSKPGIQLGVVASYSMNENLMFQPGIIFSQQGGKWKGTGSETYWGVKAEYDMEVEMTLNYLQIPLNYLYKHDLDSDISLLLQVGPYIGYGINGKLKMKATVKAGGTSENISEEDDLTFGNDGELNFIDLGLGLGAGLLFKEKIHVGLGYNLGVAKIASDVNMKNKGFALTVSYFFGK